MDKYRAVSCVIADGKSYQPGQELPTLSKIDIAWMLRHGLIEKITPEHGAKKDASQNGTGETGKQEE